MPRALPALLTLAIALLVCRPPAPERAAEAAALRAHDGVAVLHTAPLGPAPVALAPPAPVASRPAPAAPPRARRDLAPPCLAPACGSAFVLRDAPLLL